MKILNIIASMNPIGGGPAEGVRRYDEIFTRMGHTCTTVSLDTPAERVALQADYAGKLVTLGNGIGGYGYLPALVPWLRRNAASHDVVIIQGIWQYHSLAVWRALARTDTPYYVFTHGMLDPWFKKTYRLKHQKKLIYWLMAERRVLRDARAILFTCEDERLLARESFPFYDVREIVSGYGTASPPEDNEGLSFSFRNQYPEIKKKKIILFLSRIHQKKGCDLALEAFSRVAHENPDLHLVIAGPDHGNWLPKLQARAQELNIASRVTWPGMLRGKEKWGAFYAADVFLLPSHQENFGIVVAEALGCGKPVLISKQVNIWREVLAEGAGFAAEDTLAGTLDNLNRWLDMSDTERSAIEQRALNCFRGSFHIERAVERLLDIFRKDGIIS